MKKLMSTLQSFLKLREQNPWDKTEEQLKTE